MVAVCRCRRRRSRASLACERGNGWLTSNEGVEFPQRGLPACLCQLVGCCVKTAAAAAAAAAGEWIELCMARGSLCLRYDFGSGLIRAPSRSVSFWIWLALPLDLRRSRAVRKAGLCKGWLLLRTESAHKAQPCVSGALRSTSRWGAFIFLLASFALLAQANELCAQESGSGAGKGHTTPALWPRILRPLPLLLLLLFCSRVLLRRRRSESASALASTERSQARQLPLVCVLLTACLPAFTVLCVLLLGSKQCERERETSSVLLDVEFQCHCRVHCAQQQAQESESESERENKRLLPASPA